LSKIVPEKRTEILARAEEYAHNQLVCGVHYPSDIEASRRIACMVLGYIRRRPGSSATSRQSSSCDRSLVLADK
jgi:acid phosphatase (class A)